MHKIYRCSYSNSRALVNFFHFQIEVKHVSNNSIEQGLQTCGICAEIERKTISMARDKFKIDNHKKKNYLL